MEHYTATNKTDITESPEKKSLKINLESIESDSTTDEIFGMTASVEKKYHIASKEVDRIFDCNAIHCTEVKNYTSDDSEQLKDYCGHINPATVPTRFQDIQKDQHSSQCIWPWDGFYFLQ